MPNLGPSFKIALACAVVAVVGWLAFRGVSRFLQRFEDTNPYPTDPNVATTAFFTALAQKDYQHCYQLLPINRTAATIINRASREEYALHFERIRAYLANHAGPDFLASMTVGAGGEKVTFKNGIVLTVDIAYAGQGAGHALHYAINQISEFPIDVAPGLGVEEYNRSVEGMIESSASKEESPPPSDDPADFLGIRPGEAPVQREKRFIDEVKRGRQLDARHIALEKLVKEFSGQPATRQLLSDLAANEKEVPQLRLLAQQNLNRRKSR
jgi:hypothetical protein